MTATQSPALLVAGLLSFTAAAAHLACIAGGAGWYRAMGAGERMARAAEQGQWRPALVTLGIATGLGVWGLYAWSGAGLLGPLPSLRWVLVAITAIYLARGLLFTALRPYFPGNSTAFWYWSSGICLVIGLFHLAGLWQSWVRLGAA